jgi:phosphoglycolate phosphatase-like HAD superfamily hydrolase
MTSLNERASRLYRESPCVLLDCDGVIFDSNGFKLEALRQALVGYPERAVAEMERFWTAHGGMARYPKLEHFFRQILPVEGAKVEAVSTEVDRVAARFGELSRRAFASAQPIPEALAFARTTGTHRCFVVSGADQAELRDIFRDKEIDGLFEEVCGSPTSKLAHVERILAERRCDPARALLIGDGAGDFEVCRTLGVPFIYLDQYSEWTAAKASLAGITDVAVFDTWSQVLSYLGIEGAP